jgi:hypothetical protein
MLSINGLHNFYYLPGLHDMRCKAPRIFEIIRVKYHRDPFNGDVYVFMSKDQTKVKMIHYENHAYYLHEKTFVDGYRFVQVKFTGDGERAYRIDWKDLVAVLQAPVIKTLRIS